MGFSGLFYIFSYTIHSRPKSKKMLNNNCGFNIHETIQEYFMIRHFLAKHEFLKKLQSSSEIMLEQIWKNIFFLFPACIKLTFVLFCLLHSCRNKVISTKVGLALCLTSRHCYNKICNCPLWYFSVFQISEKLLRAISLISCTGCFKLTAKENELII